MTFTYILSKAKALIDFRANRKFFFENQGAVYNNMINQFDSIIQGIPDEYMLDDIKLLNESYKNIIDLFVKNPIKDVHGQSVLLLATIDDITSLAIDLIEAGADVNEPCNENCTPILKATYHHNLEVVNALLNHGAKANIPDIRSQTPILLAALFNHKNILKILMSHKKDLIQNETEAYLSYSFLLYKKDIESITLLLNYDASVVPAFIKTYPKQPSATKDLMHYALLTSITANHMPSVKALLLHDRSLTHMENDGSETALMSAVRSKSFECVRLVLMYDKQTLEWRHQFGYNALQLAQDLRLPQIAEIIFQAVCAKNRPAPKPLHYISHFQPGSNK